jgi:hypothetical protein
MKVISTIYEDNENSTPVTNLVVLEEVGGTDYFALQT